MGCLVQAIGETLVTEVSVEIGKHISLLSNQALGPVLHSLIQMRVPHMGLAKIDPHYLCLTDTHVRTVSILLCFAAACLAYLRCSLPFICFSFLQQQQKWRNLQNLSVILTLMGSCGSGSWAWKGAHSDSKLGWEVNMCSQLQHRLDAYSKREAWLTSCQPCVAPPTPACVCLTCRQWCKVGSSFLSLSLTSGLATRWRF